MVNLTKIRERFQRKQSGTQYRTLLQILHLDILLLFGILILIIFGLFILYSASNQNSHVIVQESIHIGLAAIVMIVLAQLPSGFYQRWAPWLFGISIAFLIAVLAIGHINKGAQRWLNLGFLRFQPSELMKLVLPMMLAWYFANQNLPPTKKDLLICGLITIVPVLLTFKEPDLGTATILILTGIVVLFFAGIGWRWIIGTCTAGIVLTPLAWHFMHGYQKERILTFFNPSRDPLGTGYHIIQSKIAIGSGGFFGKGWLAGTQSHLHFLPEHATDFIFAVCGEEFGLIGGFILLSIYLLIISRCIYIASQAQDTFSRLLASTLSLMFFLSVFINIGMVSGILPVVGLPLPLISYGGSSMVTTMASFGILMAIHGHRRLLSK